MLSGNKSELNYALTEFKDRGLIKFDKVLSIRSDQRIPVLAKTLEGRMKVSAAITASIKSAFDNINLRIGLTPDQTVEIAEQIIDQSEEDYLSLEDVLLFLQQLVTGKAGKIYDRMDVPTFFELFENYRESRYQELVRIRKDQKAAHRDFEYEAGLERSSTSRNDADVKAMGEYLKEKWSK
jgi:hypothetical protein